MRTFGGRNRDQDRVREQMGCMKLCGHFQIKPEPGHGPRPIVPYCSSLGPGSSQCEYIITPVVFSISYVLIFISNFQTSFVDCLMEWTHTELEAREGRDVSNICQCMFDEKTVKLLVTIVKLLSHFFSCFSCATQILYLRRDR